MSENGAIYSIICANKRPLRKGLDAKAADKCKLSCPHLFFENGDYICNIGKMRKVGKK